MNSSNVCIVLLCAITLGSCDQFQKVLFKDVNSLTFTRNRHAQGRRSTVPEMRCIGGSAANTDYSPESMKCEKLDNSLNPKWKCTANMDSKYKLGVVSVGCEGYEYPGDEYITDGSCGVEYHLDYTPNEWGRVELFATIIMVLIVVAFIVATWVTPDIFNSANMADGSGSNQGSHTHYHNHHSCCRRRRSPSPYKSTHKSETTGGTHFR